MANWAIVIGIDRSPAVFSWSVNILSSALPELAEPASPTKKPGWRAALTATRASIGSIFACAWSVSPFMSQVTMTVRRSFEI